jgi:hypothetical protein
MLKVQENWAQTSSLSEQRPSEMYTSPVGPVAAEADDETFLMQ